jgi:hypothetical protein
MKNSFLLSLVAVIATFTGSFKPALAQTGATGNNLVIVCSPSLSDEDRRLVFTLIGKTLTDNMNPGDHLALYNGKTVKPVADLTYSPQAKTLKAKLREGGPFMAQVKEFLSKPGEGDKTIMIPQFFDNLGQTSQSSQFRILVIGSPVYKDSNPLYDMSKGWFNDGYMNAAPVNSLFSLKGKSSLIKGSTVYYCYLSDDLFETLNKPAHKAGVQGFWSRYVEGVGGRMMMFIPDITNSFKSWASGFASKIEYDPLNTTVSNLQIVTPNVIKKYDPNAVQQVQQMNSTTTTHEGSQNTTVHEGASSN